MNSFNQLSFLGGVFPTTEVLYLEKLPMNVAQVTIPNNSATKKMSGLIITMPDKQANHWAEIVLINGTTYYLSPHKPHFFFGNSDSFKNGVVKFTNNWASSDFITFTFF
jgi:hypothetical protein